LCPDLSGHIVMAMVRQCAQAHRARRRRRTCGRPLVVPGIAADMRAPNFGGEREPGVGLRRMQGIAQWYGANRGTLARPGWEGQLANALADAARKVRTFRCGRSSMTGLSPPEHSGQRPPARKPVSAEWSGLPPGAGRAPTRTTRRRDKVADHPVLSDQTKPTAAGLERAGIADVNQRVAATGRTATRSAWSSCPAVWPPRPSANSQQRPHTPHPGCPAEASQSRELARTAPPFQRANFPIMARHGSP
jgi:hypothetical protein